MPEKRVQFKDALTEFEWIMKTYESVVVDVLKSDPSIGAFLERGKLVSMTKEEIIIGFQENQSVAIFRCRSDKAITVISDAVYKRFKRPFVVKVIALKHEECHRGVKDDFGLRYIMHKKIRT